MSLNETIVKHAALEWFGVLVYSIGYRPHFAPGEPAVEQDSFGEVVIRRMYKNQSGMLKP